MVYKILKAMLSKAINLILSLIVIVLLNHCHYVDDVVLNKKTISKAILVISRDSGIQKIIFTDRSTLDKIDNALKSLRDTDVQRGGALEQFAKMIIYKQNK